MVLRSPHAAAPSSARFHQRPTQCAIAMEQIARRHARTRIDWRLSALYGCTHKAAGNRVYLGVCCQIVSG